MKNKILTQISFVIVLVTVAVEMFPLIVIFINSFKKDIDIWMGKFLVFKPTLQSYTDVLTNSDFPRALTNSLIVAFSTTVIAILLGSMASYGLARFQFKIRNVVILILLILRMIPQITLAVPFYMMFRSLGLRDTLLGLILAHTSFNLPYVIALLLPFFADIPKDYEEAARIDGCTEVMLFWKIFFPLASPGIVVAAIFAFLMSWNEFIYALILGGSRVRLASVAVQSFLGQYAPLWGQLSAAGMLMLIPVFIITLGLQRYIIQGLSAGGIKG